MYLVRVQFQDYDREGFTAANDIQTKGAKRYDYVSDAEFQKGDLVVVPTYSDADNLKIARVNDCMPLDRENHTLTQTGPNGGRFSLRFVVAHIDMEAFIARREAEQNAKRARKMIEEAAKHKSHLTLYDEVKAELSPADRAFIERALNIPIALPAGDSQTRSAEDASGP